MEFKGFKIDFNALALLITAITTAFSTWKGYKNRKNRRK